MSNGSALLPSRLTYKDSQGRLASELIYRDREAELEILKSGKPWSFDGDAEQFRLVSRGAPHSACLPLRSPSGRPHISGWNHSPIRSPPCTRLCCRVILCASSCRRTPRLGQNHHDRPAHQGNFMARGDLQRCMIVCPGNLVDQWQDRA